MIPFDQVVDASHKHADERTTERKIYKPAKEGVEKDHRKFIQSLVDDNQFISKHSWIRAFFSIYVNR